MKQKLTELQKKKRQTHRYSQRFQRLSLSIIISSKVRQIIYMEVDDLKNTIIFLLNLYL